MKPSKEQLARINQLSQRELSADEVEVHQFLVGNKAVTAYNTIFDDRTLRKFAADLQKGDVAMAELHNTRGKLPTGRAFDGRIDEKYNVYGMFYIPKALDDSKVSDRIEFGTLFDVSMGVSVSRYECSICHFDLRDWKNCSHFPGQECNVGTAEEPKLQTCYGIMMGKNEVDSPLGKMFSDVNLSETSVVTDGAVPGAGVVAGSFDAETGKMNFGALTLTKTQDTDVFAATHFQAAGKIVYTQKQKENEKTPEELAAEEAALLAAAAAAQGGTEVEKLAAKVDALTAKIAEFGAVDGNKKVEALEAELAASKDAFADILCKMAVKLNGNTFDAVAALVEFKKLSPVEAAAKFADLQTQVAAKFPAGRKTAPEDLSTANADEDDFNGLFNV